MKILFFGDIFGRPGRAAVKRYLEENRQKLGVDLVVANADNMAAGRGPTRKTYEEMREAGVDVLTVGDHIWDQKEVYDILDDRDHRLLRPLNYPEDVPGRGFVSVPVGGHEVLVVSLLGRVWTAEGLDSPFLIMDKLLSERKEKIIIVDFHAEATSEKIAIGHYLTDRVSAVLGTHTHVQTADEKILGEGTAYISDTGQCGPSDSVIGVEKQQSIKRFRTGLPVAFTPAEGPTQINAVLVEIDPKAGRAKKIERITESYE